MYTSGNFLYHTIQTLGHINIHVNRDIQVILQQYMTKICWWEYTLIKDFYGCKLLRKKFSQFLL